MTSPLSQRARLLLDRYKAGESLPEASKARLLATLMRASAHGTQPRFALQETKAGPEPHAPQNLWRKPLGRAVAIALFALPALALAALAIRSTSSTPPSIPLNTPSKSATPGAFSAAEVPTLETTTPDPPPAVATETSAKPAKRAAAPNRAPRASAPDAPGDEPTIDGETLLLNEAQAANLAGDSRRALTLLDEYSRRFPSGRLTDVKTVARLVALCTLGQVSLVRREAARFEARHPNSPFAERVNRICPTKAAP